MSAARSAVLHSAPGDILSPSACSGYLRCSAAWYFKRIERLPDPPTGARTMGLAVHDAIAENLLQKIETKRDLDAAGVTALYRDNWAVKATETEFRDDEDKDELKAQGESLALLYLHEACPYIEPAAVEQHVTGRIGGVMVQGFIDLLDVDGCIIDLKTAAKTPSKSGDGYEISADYRFQVATYAQIHPAASGKARVDTLVKTKTPKLVKQEFTVNQSDVDQTEQMYPRVQAAIRAELFLPNRGSWMCSRKHCAFWRACTKCFGGKVPE